MAKEILVPQLGESVIEATVGEWLREEGSAVQVGDVVVELETDKVDVEVGATAAGILKTITQQTGADVKVGDVLGVIEEQDGGEAAEEQRSRPVPSEAEGGAEEQRSGGAEDDGQMAPVAKVEAADSRGVTPVARRLAEASGVDLAEVAGTGPGGRVTKQDVAAHVQGGKEAEPAPSLSKEEQESRLVQSEAEGGADLSRAKPREEQRTDAQALDRAGVAAPGPDVGTNVGTDVGTNVGTNVAPDVVPIPRSDLAARPEERVRMSRRRRTIAQRLVEAQQTAAMLTTFNEIDMGVVIDIRKRRQEAFVARHGVKLGFSSFFVKASVGALKAFPRLNAEIQGDEMVLKHYYDIGMAVGAEDGLVVPVIRDADKKTFAQIEQDVKALADKATSGTLSLEELRGGTFTITNGGVFGSMLSTPILNPPQVGILGLHNIVERPVARNGEVVIRPVMYVALTYDHRLVDGREAVQFLVRVKELIEDPERLLLEG